MQDQSVTASIELLVDHLRVNRNRDVTLGDVAGVTEVLLTTMQRYFTKIDTTIYTEFRNLAERIGQVRTEIAELNSDDVKDDKIPRAGRELEAIVQATEEASGTIMDAAEEIINADASDIEAYQATVVDACMRIFEACSFQDITGQRITKVVDTLTYIEERLQGLQTAWGPGEDEEAAATKKDGDVADLNNVDVETERANLLSGPALAGEGIGQDDIDSLLNGDDDVNVASPATEPAPACEKSAPKTAPKPEKPAEKPVIADSTEDGDDGDAEDFSQEDIDALFD